ncbi:MAG TPA: N-acetylglucosamine-6-phosphate deacetylase, partial [Isosphaeraceae bacterium]|nr:N-acetylglucosamine-6-phosphate deacetylase [Isosphaeraceae bacterium]
MSKLPPLWSGRGGFPLRVVARDFHDSHWLELEVSDGRIAAVRSAGGPTVVGPLDDWVAPAFWDIQMNGRWGHSFSSSDLSVDQVVSIVRVQATLGTARLCPTLITAPLDHMLHGLRTIATACDAFPDVAARIVGIHLEGPFLSERDGYRGAHPVASIRDPDWELFQEFQSAASGRIILITLASERPGSLEFIRRATGMGVVVALGHTAADGPTIHAAVQAGARLSTHLGNGIASPLPRHPNPIWEQ